ncbi:MAG: hypothetical protein LBS79_05470, partial [Tannerella sp.]|nr:hypothetical protein [Tannerella sp.]
MRGSLEKAPLIFFSLQDVWEYPAKQAAKRQNILWIYSGDYMFLYSSRLLFGSFFITSSTEWSISS